MDNERARGGAGDRLFLGLDLSTQSLQGILIDESLTVLGDCSIHFDTDLPAFGTTGGVHRHEDGVTVTSPAPMWVAALDLLLERMKAERWPLERIVAVSGSGQQHGSVWLNAAAESALAGLDAERTLGEQLAGIFSRADSPIWMDTSTARQCAAREAALGGPQAVADVTGSRAYERFTGNQIARVAQEQPDVYGATERIALVSSFGASVLAGAVAPIDWSDGSGMNLLDLRTRTWWTAALDCTASDLARRLGEPVAPHTVVGRLHRYYRQRYGFAGDCAVIAFSGDNPNSLAGLLLRDVGDLAVSLGTSDTVFGSLTEPRPSGEEGHIFVNPVDPTAYMAMIVRQNGSLTREAVRDASAAGSWERFEEHLRATPPGNGGRLGFYYRAPEITPPVRTPGIRRFDAQDAPVESFAPAADVRAVVENQFLTMRVHGTRVGLAPRRIFVTGGASRNRAVVQVLADVFGVPVSSGEVTGSAALGAAYRAAHGRQCADAGRFVAFKDTVGSRGGGTVTVEPDPAATAAYNRLLDRFAALEARAVFRASR